MAAKGGVPVFLRELRAKVGTALLVLPAVSCVAYDDKGRVLMIRHSNDGQWCFPGGIIEPDEHPARRAVIEMKEETGLNAEVSGVIGVYGGPECRVRYWNGDEVSYVVIAYECVVVGGTEKADGAEALELGYFSEAEIASMPLSMIGRAEARAAFGHLSAAESMGTES